MPIVYGLVTAAILGLIGAGWRYRKHWSAEQQRQRDAQAARDAQQRRDERARQIVSHFWECTHPGEVVSAGMMGDLLPLVGQYNELQCEHRRWDQALPA